MSAAKIAEYKKAIGGFVGTAIPLLGAIIAANVLTGSAAHNAAIILAGLTAIGGPLGVAIAPKNGPKQNVLVDDVKTLLGNASEIRGAIMDAAKETEQDTHPPLTTVLTPSGILGGTVTPAPELEPPGTEGN